MNDLEATLVFSATLVVVLALWHPAKQSTSGLTGEMLERKNLDLSQLITLLEVLPNFQTAYQKWNPGNTSIDAKLDLQLKQVSRLSQDYGISASHLVALLERQKVMQYSIWSQWQELAAPARATSKLLTFLPVITHLVAFSIGIQATQWLFSNPIGIGLLLVSSALTALSILAQRRNPLSKLRTLTLSSEYASIGVFFTICIWQPNVPGVAIALVLSMLVSDLWSMFLHQSQKERLQARKYEVIWELSIVIGALQTGMNWSAVLELLENELGSAEKLEVRTIRQRIEQGVSPQEAFSRSEIWQDIGTSLTFAQWEGSRVIPVLSAIRDSTINAYRTYQEIRIRRQSQILTVMVSALQLPAFIAVGLLPIAAEPITTLLSQFSSTVSLT